MENRNCPWLTLASLGPFMKRELLVLLLGAWAAHPVIVVTSVVFRLDSRRVGVQPAAAVRAREAVAVFLFVGVLSPPGPRQTWLKCLKILGPVPKCFASPLLRSLSQTPLWTRGQRVS
jgi:hypothetical protein